MHPGISAVDYLNQTKFEGLIYVLGSTNVKQLLTKAGYEIFDGVCVWRLIIKNQYLLLFISTRAATNND